MMMMIVIGDHDKLTRHNSIANPSRDIKVALVAYYTARLLSDAGDSVDGRDDNCHAKCCC